MAMKFVILGFDGPEGQALRKIHRSTHIQRIERWNSRHRVILAGPLTDNVGSLIILEADSRQEVEEFVREDPYTAFGVFNRVEIHPFVQVFPAEQSEPDLS
jgi:uncharacterized protein YciI